MFNEEVKGLQGEKGKLENYVLKLERDVFEKKAELQELTTIPKTSTLGKIESMLAQVSSMLIESMDESQKQLLSMD